MTSVPLLVSAQPKSEAMLGHQWPKRARYLHVLLGQSTAEGHRGRLHCRTGAPVKVSQNDLYLTLLMLGVRRSGADNHLQAEGIHVHVHAHHAVRDERLVGALHRLFPRCTHAPLQVSCMLILPAAALQRHAKACKLAVAAPRTRPHAITSNRTHARDAFQSCSH